MKELLNYKVDKAVMAENLAVSNGGPAITMLINEHKLLCQIRINDTEEQNIQMVHSPINDQYLPLIVGLTELEIDSPKELVTNNQGSYMIVSNNQMVEILSSVVDLGNNE